MAAAEDDDRCELCGDPAGEGQRTADLILCWGCANDLRPACGDRDPVPPDLGGEG